MKHNWQIVSSPCSLIVSSPRSLMFLELRTCVLVDERSGYLRLQETCSVEMVKEAYLKYWSGLKM